MQISFNDIDSGVDRRSHQGVYDVVDGIPRYACFAHYRFLFFASLAKALYLPYLYLDFFFLKS